MGGGVGAMFKREVCSITLFYGRKQHNTVKQLPSPYKVTEQLNNEAESNALFVDDIAICVMTSQEPSKEPTGL